MAELAEQLRNLYSGKRMSDDQVDAVLAAADAVRRSPRRLRRWWAAAAAALALLLGAGSASLLVWPRSGLAERVAEEIALHHLKNEPPQVTTPRYKQIQATLNRLTFTVLPTRPCLLNHYEPIGGRYCSVQDNPAAQIKLKDLQKGDVHTLYVTDLIPAFRRLDHITLYRSGVMVEIWTEDNRLFALATDADEP